MPCNSCYPGARFITNDQRYSGLGMMPEMADYLFCIGAGPGGENSDFFHRAKIAAWLLRLEQVTGNYFGWSWRLGVNKWFKTNKIKYLISCCGAADTHFLPNFANIAKEETKLT